MASLIFSTNKSGSRPMADVQTDAPLTLRGFYHCNQLIMGSVACAVNFALLLLLASEPNPHIRRYSVVLVVTALFDIGLALTGMLVEPQMEFNNGHFLFVFSGVLQGRPVAWRYGQLFVYVFYGCFACCQPPVIFIFRYALIVNRRKSRLLSFRNRRLPSRAVFAMFGLIAVLSFIQASSSILAFIRNEPERSATCERLLTHHVWHTGRPTDCISTSRYSFALMGALLYAIFLIVVAYCIMITTTVVIFRQLRRSTQKMSVKTIKLQKQFNRILVAQIILPFIFGFVPVNVLAIFPLLGITVPGVGVVVTMFVGWVTFISPLTTIFLIASFRRRALAILRPAAICRRRWYVKCKPASSVVPTSQTIANQATTKRRSQTATSNNLL